jgi:hypothetical protein
MNFTHESQPLVDAAFLAQAVLRAPTALRDPLDAGTKRRLVAALESTRSITPGFNNWLLFSATVEAALKTLDAPWDRLRVDYALRQHEEWYRGDGLYGDGPTFHWDYYNSFVIQPMLLDVLETCGGDAPGWGDMRSRVLERARRYAVILERLIAPDGSFPAIGRSLAYRCGAFHLLAALALKRQLPEPITPGQARAALTAVIQRTLDAPGTFDKDGWLTIGLAGHQPTLGEKYISTGSLYLSAVAFLPLQNRITGHPVPRQHGATVDVAAGLDANFGNASRQRRGNPMQNLHRVDYQQHVSGRYGVTLLDPDFVDHPRQRSHE